MSKSKGMHSDSLALVNRRKDLHGFEPQDDAQEERSESKAERKREAKAGDDDSEQGGDWIESAVKRPGALHKKLGIAPNKKIPAAKVDDAARKPGLLGQEARFAKNMRGR